MSSTLVATREYAERSIAFALTGAPDVAPKYLRVPPDVPPMRPTVLYARYDSRDGAPWGLETVHVRGTYAPTDPFSLWEDSQAGGFRLYPSSSRYPLDAKPEWAAGLAHALAVPAREVTAGAVTAAATSDVSRRMRFFTLGGLDEIAHWMTPSPLRPDKVRIIYRSSGDAGWGLTSIRFEGPYVATGKSPGPGQNRGLKNYYPDSLADAPAWVQDIAEAHRVPDPLPAGQRP